MGILTLVLSTLIAVTIFRNPDGKLTKASLANTRSWLSNRKVSVPTRPYEDLTATLSYLAIYVAFVILFLIYMGVVKWDTGLVRVSERQLSELTSKLNAGSAAGQEYRGSLGTLLEDW